MKKIVLLAVVAAAATASLLFFTSKPAPPPSETPEASVASPAKEDGASAAARFAARRTGRPAERPEEERPSAVPALDRSAAVLESCLLNIRRMIAGGEEDARFGQLQAELAAFLSENPENLNRVMEKLRTESDTAVFSALGRMTMGAADAGGQKWVAALALETLSGPATDDRRQAGLDILANAASPEPQWIQSVAGISRTSTNPDIVKSAVQAMTAWMERSPEGLAHVGRELMQTLNASADAGIRHFGLQEITRRNLPLSENMVAEMAFCLRNDDSPENRVLAAKAIGGAAEAARPAALACLREAYTAETDPDNRRLFIGQMVRAGKTDAADLLRQLPARDPALAQDIRDYLEILESGQMDEDSIIAEKNAREARRAAEARNPAPPEP